MQTQCEVEYSFKQSVNLRASIFERENRSVTGNKHKALKERYRAQFPTVDASSHLLQSFLVFLKIYTISTLENDNYTGW